MFLKQRMHPKLPDYRELDGMAEPASSNLTEVAEVATTTVASLATTALKAAVELATTAVPRVAETTRAALASPATYLPATSTSSSQLSETGSTTTPLGVASLCQVT